VEGARHSAETQATIAQLPAYVVEFRFVFAKKDFNILPEHRKWDHAIELTPRVEPKSSKVYSLSPLEQEELNTFLEENLHIRQIRPSKFPIAAPMFFIKKKDGSLQLVQDYCALNAERVQKGIAHWDKQNHAMPAPNCMLKVQGEIIKDEGL